MSTKPETQSERDDLIAELESMAVAARGVNYQEHPCYKAAAMLAADGKAGGAAIGTVVEVGDKQVNRAWFAVVRLSRGVKRGESLYTRPQQAAQVAQPLTDNAIDIYIMQNKLMDQAWPTQKQLHQFARDIAGHGIGKDKA